MFGQALGQENPSRVARPLPRLCRSERASESGTPSPGPRFRYRPHPKPPNGVGVGLLGGVPLPSQDVLDPLLLSRAIQEAPLTGGPSLFCLVRQSQAPAPAPPPQGFPP